MTADQLEAEILRIAPQVQNFLGSDAADVVFTELDRRFFGEFKQSRTDEARLTAWAKSQALGELRIALQGIADTATLLEHRAKGAKSATA